METKNFLAIVTAVTIFLADCCSLWSQRPGLYIPYVEIGIQKTSITGSESWEDPVGFQAGAGMPVAVLTDLIKLRIEANISSQGANWNDAGFAGTTNLLYLNIPVTARYQTESGLFGEVGIQPGYLLRAKDNYDDGSSDDYMDHMNRFDLSIPLGIGYEFKNNVGVGLRFIPGINDITKDPDDKDRNLVIALRGTYTFR